MKIIKIGAVWCMQCLAMRPVWEKIEEEIEGLETEYFDIDEKPEIKEKYGLKDIPIFIFLDKDGNEILRLEGLQNKEDLIRIIRDYWGQ